MKALPQELQVDLVPDQFKQAESAIQTAIEEQIFAGGVSIVSNSSRILYSRALGNSSFAPFDQEQYAHRLSFRSVFDLGEISALIATIPIAMRLCEERRLCLSDKIARYLHGFGVHGKSAVTLEQILNHTAGLAAQANFHEELVVQNKGRRVGILTSKGARDFVLRDLNRSKLKHTPGGKHVFSQVGLILLGFIIEEVTGQTLDKVARKYVFKPLELQSTSYVDLSLIRRGLLTPDENIIVPTLECPWRKKLLLGEVMDPAAWAIGGVAGNAGIFSCAGDLQRIAAEFLAAYQGQSDFLSRTSLDLMWQTGQDSAISPYTWERPSAENGMEYAGFSESARGYFSSTGSAFWIDPKRDLSFIFLSNCCQSSRGHKRLSSFWAKYFAAVNQAIGDI